MQHFLPHIFSHTYAILNDSKAALYSNTLVSLLIMRLHINSTRYHAFHLLSLVLLIRKEPSSICRLKTFTDVFECFCFCIVGHEGQSEAGADIAGWCLLLV